MKATALAPVTLKSRFWQCTVGATAVELAFVLPIFFGLVLGVLETGWLMTKFTMIDRAVTKASRFIYTGAASTGNTVTQQTLEDFICEEAVIISDCAENIALELIIIGNFSTPPVTNAPCRESEVGIEPTTTFQPGASSEVVFMRVCVTTEILMPLIGLGLAVDKTDNGNFQFTSGTAFANEPF